MHLLELIAMLGAVQGVLLMLLVAFRFRHRINVPLALLLLAFAVRLGTIPSWNQDTLQAGRWFLIITGPLPLLFGPLVWWYVRELTLARSRPPRYLALHAVPYLAETAALSVLLLSMSAGDYASFVTATFNGEPPWWMSARHIGKFASGLAYAVPSAILAFGPRDSHGTCADRARVWPRVVVLSPLVSLVAFAFAAFRPEAAALAARQSGLSPFVLPAIAMMATIYIFSLVVLLYPQTLTGPNEKPLEADVSLHPGSRAGSAAPVHSRSTAPAFHSEAGGCPDDQRSSDSTESGVRDPESRRIAERVRVHLEAGAYLDPELSLRGMAEALDVNPNRLSAAVNRSFGENFCRLVNRYRLDYFAGRVSAGALRERTVLDVAFESGFPSKSTFNRVFKQRFGTAPSRYARETESWNRDRG